jgi:hypothetical protein
MTQTLPFVVVVGTFAGLAIKIILDFMLKP